MSRICYKKWFFFFQNNHLFQLNFQTNHFFQLYIKLLIFQTKKNRNKKHVSDQLTPMYRRYMHASVLLAPMCIFYIHASIPLASICIFYMHALNDLTPICINFYFICYMNVSTGLTHKYNFEIMRQLVCSILVAIFLFEMYIIWYIVGKDDQFEI